MTGIHQIFGHGSVSWRQRDMLQISGFMDNIIFARTWKRHIVKVTQQGTARFVSVACTQTGPPGGSNRLGMESDIFSIAALVIKKPSWCCVGVVTVKAYHIKWQELPIDTNIKKWSVHVLNLDRQKRHLDRATLNQFWEILDRLFRLSAYPPANTQQVIQCNACSWSSGLAKFLSKFVNTVLTGVSTNTCQYLCYLA